MVPLEEVVICIPSSRSPVSLSFLHLALIIRAMQAEICSGLIQMIISACDCLPTVLLYSLFRCGWNVNSHETDFYFNKTAAQCRTELTLFKNQNHLFVLEN